MVDFTPYIDEDELIELARGLVDIPSPTGEEYEVARFFGEYLRGIGMEVTSQEVEPDRNNVLATWEGDPAGPVLMFNGHFDTSYSGREPAVRHKPGYQPKAFIKDRFIHGLGIHNMKGSLAAYAIAVKAVKDSGFPLKGTVRIGGVVGEIETAQVDAYQGRRYRGSGIGVRHMVTHGGVADMAVIGEPTELKLMPGHHGFSWFKVTVTGDFVHTAVSRRARHSVDAFRKLLAALDDWADGYRASGTYLGEPPVVNIVGVDGGIPSRSRTPAEMAVFLDIRTLPNESPVDIERSLKIALRRLEAVDGVRADCHLYLSRPGVETSEAEPVYQAVVDAHQHLFRAAPDLVCKVWSSDASTLNRYGIPTVNYGPSGRGWDPSVGEHTSIDDLVRCTHVYARTIANICGGKEAE